MNSSMRSPCDLVLHASYTILDDIASSFKEQYSLAIRDGRICGIGQRAEIETAWEGKEERDFGNALMIPGLINAHTHVAMTFLRGYADDLDLHTWLTTKIFPVEAKLTENIVRFSSLLGFAEMLASGTTACIDMYLFEEAAFASAEQAGIRFAGGEVFFSFPTPVCATNRKALELTEELVRRYKHHPRLSVMLNPHSIYTTNQKILSETIAFAESNDIPIHIHLAETAKESSDALTQFGMRPIAYCDSLGLFGVKTTLAHMVDVTESELDFLADHPSSVLVHNPTSNMKLTSGIANVPGMLDRHLPLALGTDGATSNNTLNMFTAMNHAALLHKVHTGNPKAVSAQDVFRMATQGGAKAFHRSDIGSLRVGNCADIAVLDLNSPNLVPIYHPISHLAYAASGHEVICTIVHGTICYDHGSFPLFSLPDVLEEMRDIQEFIKRQM